MSHAPFFGTTQAAFSSHPPRQAVVDRGDELWKKLIAEANRAYERNDIDVARTIYGQALSKAEKLFDTAMTGPGFLPVPVIYNITCHNIATLEEGQGNHAAARAYYRRAYDKLMEGAASPTVLLAQRVACVQHLKHALAALVQHLQTTGEFANGGSTDVINDLVSRAHQMAFNVYHVVRHAEIATANCSHCTIELS